MHRLYLKYDWKEEHLNNQTVEFAIHGDDYHAEGIGIMSVSEKIEKGVRTGLLSVEVVAQTSHSDLSVKRKFWFRPTQTLRFQIERHPNQDVAALRLSSYKIQSEVQDIPR